MSWLGLIKGLLSFVSKLTTYLNNKSLMDAGAAKQIVKNVEAANEAIKRANDARSNIGNSSMSDDTNNRDRL